ncbi:OX-2 membrane glycoprotein-like isoform 2-T2 [Anableps anableps]
MLLILTVICLALKGHASDISLHGPATVPYGGEARFTCTLADPTGVLQVTWQRGLKPELLENLATYNKPVGKQVNEPFKDKVNFTESSLKSSSIVLRNVTWEDENCYVCSFNAYPEGSKRKQMCLKVEGISETHKMNISKSNSALKVREEVLSCSATGKPAPTISWNISSSVLSKDPQQTTTVSNSDGTFTSSSNITVQIPTDRRGHVVCILNRGLTGERQEEFPFSSLEEEREEGNWSRHALIIAVLAIIVICITAVAAVIIHKRLKRTCNGFTAV